MLSRPVSRPGSVYPARTASLGPTPADRTRAEGQASHRLGPTCAHTQPDFFHRGGDVGSFHRAKNCSDATFDGPYRGSMSLMTAPPSTPVGPSPACPPPAAPPPGPPSAGHAVVRFVASLADTVDRVAQAPVWSMTQEEQRAALVGLARAQSRLKELELQVLLQAERDGIGAESGAVSAPAWFAHATKTTTASRYRDLHLATGLDARFPATRRALAAGLIDVEKASIIAAAVDSLTTEHDLLPPETHQRAEAHLIEHAQTFDAPTLRRLVKRLFEVVCPEAADAAEGQQLKKEEAAARAHASFSMHDTGDGTSEGRFRLPTLHAQLLKKALEALTSPRRLGEGRLDPRTGKKLAHATLLGQGLMELVENHLRDLPSVNGSPFTLVVTIGIDALLFGLGVAELETGHRISAGEARRLACKSGIIPMVLDGDSVPLDLGREQRLFDRYQKFAINHRYHGCAAYNCDRPPAWVEFHHEDPWHLGGSTDAKKGIPLCPAHHHMADHPDTYHMRRLPNGKVRFTRRT